MSKPVYTNLFNHYWGHRMYTHLQNLAGMKLADMELDEQSYQVLRDVADTAQYLLDEMQLQGYGYTDLVQRAKANSTPAAPDESEDAG